MNVDSLTPYVQYIQTSLVIDRNHLSILHPSHPLLLNLLVLLVVVGRNRGQIRLGTGRDVVGRAGIEQPAKSQKEFLQARYNPGQVYSGIFKSMYSLPGALANRWRSAAAFSRAAVRMALRSSNTFSDGVHFRMRLESHDSEPDSSEALVMRYRT